MDSIHAAGRQIKGIITADIATVQTFTLYDIATQEVITLVPGDILSIYLIMVNNGDTAAIVTVFDDLDGDGAVDAGEQLFAKSMNAKEQAGFAYTRGFGVKRTPKALGSVTSANSFLEFFGEIIQSAPKTHNT